ncbi:hypothetical protein [Roseovarius sp.]|uniref:hypothetical protein n=1 Tax=Roseovarius sp. TaxID=1486281 RepID=UPI0026097BE8|nr:hypothetical protein [Roseovarius sp.]
MTRIIDKRTDQPWRYRMGRRFEAFTDEVFQVIRWILLVGLASYLAQSYDPLIFDLTYWFLATLLFAYLASRFLLRPEIPFLANPTTRGQRLLQSALNFMICVMIFALVLWGVSALTEAIADYRRVL